MRESLVLLTRVGTQVRGMTRAFIDHYDDEVREEPIVAGIAEELLRAAHDTSLRLRLALPVPGAEVRAAGRPVGRVGTVVQHHEDGPVALALLKRSVAVDAALEIDGVLAAVDPDSAPEDTGTQAGREAIRRLRGQA